MVNVLTQANQRANCMLRYNTNKPCKLVNSLKRQVFTDQPWDYLPAKPATTKTTSLYSVEPLPLACLPGPMDGTNLSESYCSGTQSMEKRFIRYSLQIFVKLLLGPMTTKVSILKIWSIAYVYRLLWRKIMLMYALLFQYAIVTNTWWRTDYLVWKWMLNSLNQVAVFYRNTSP